MNKRNFLTVIGIALSFIIAIGGWFLTSTLIEIKSEKLLSASFSVATNKLDDMSLSITSKIPENVKDDLPLVRMNLTDDEIVSILRNWGTVGTETPHEPTSEQLNMDQAINTGKDWLSFMSTLSIFPDDYLYFSNPKAYLFQNLPIGQGGHFLPPSYSYWKVNFINDTMSVNMVINAVTGQVWKTEIVMYKFDIEVNDHSIAGKLTAFVSTLNINFDEDGELKNSTEAWVANKNENLYVNPIDILISKDNMTGEFESLISSRSFADNNACAEVIVSGWHFEDGRRIISNFTMHLTDKK